MLLLTMHVEEIRVEGSIAKRLPHACGHALAAKGRDIGASQR
jgi:hypothetical protein